MVLIKVPATSANLGSGFDSLGMALSLYLTVEIMEETKEWKIDHSLGESIPHDHGNLVIQIACQLVPNLTPHRLVMESEIPPARGLGSSSAAIVAGIELANHLGNLEMTDDDKIQFATKVEGHPDNVLPAILGEFVVGTVIDGLVIWGKAVFPETEILVTIPERELLTSDSRSLLPEKLSYSVAIKASSVANVLVSAIHRGDLPVAGFLMGQDLLHEPYRNNLVPELKKIREMAQKEKAYGTYLSGAGTAIVTLVDLEYAENVKNKIMSFYPEHTVVKTMVDRQGSSLH